MAKAEDQGLLILNDDTNKTAKPKSLIQALSEIEQYSVAEMHSEIPEGALPIATALSFMEVGFKSGLLSGLLTAVTTPLMMAAGQRLIPIFGEAEPTKFNQVFSIVLTVSFPICFGVFLLLYLVKSFAGNITRRAIDNLVGGVVSGAIIKTILFGLLYHYVCFQVLEPQKVVNALTWISELRMPIVYMIDYKQVYEWIMSFRKILIPSAYFILFINGVFAVLVTMALVIGRYRTHRIKEFLKEWE